MPLKIRYAFFLLFILLLLIIFSCVSVYLLYHGRYALTATTLVLLYFITYLLGKRFRKIFLVLSFLRLLKNHGGTLPLDDYAGFLDKLPGSRKNLKEKENLKKDILDILIKEEAVAVADQTIVLLSR